MHVCSSLICTVSSPPSGQRVLLIVVPFLACDDLRPIAMTGDSCWGRGETTPEWRSDGSPQYGDWGSDWVPAKESPSFLPTIPGQFVANPDEAPLVLDDEIPDLISISDDSSYSKSAASQVFLLILIWSFYRVRVCPFLE